MTNIENTDTKIRHYDNFDISVWKIDDKQWMKERRAQWPLNKIVLEHLHRLGFFRDKKPFKYIKQFFLTGQVDFPEYEGEICYVDALDEISSPLAMREIGGSIGGFLECWLTPNPSVEKWKHIIDRYESVWIERQELDNIGTIFEECRNCLLMAELYWYTEEEQREPFSNLEEKLIEFFKPFPDADDYDFYWNRVISNFLYACGWEGENLIYNPRNPIYDKAEECINSFVLYYSYTNDIIREQNKSERKFEYYSKKNKQKFIKILSFIASITKNPNEFGKKQVTFAINLLSGLEDLDLSSELKEILEEALDKPRAYE